MSIYVGVAIFICYSVMVGGSCFILGKLMNNHTMSEFIYFPNVGADWASAIAAVMSAIAAFLLFSFQKEQKKLKDREALYFTIIQIAGLYNKIHGTYLSHDNEKVFFKMISAQDKNKIFNEGNEYFYNNNFSESFNALLADLIALISFWKAFHVTREVDLLPDYCNATKILIICHDIILDVHEHKGYGDKKTFRIVEEVLLNSKKEPSEKIRNDRGWMNLKKMNETFNLIFDDFELAYKNALSDLYRNNGKNKKKKDEEVEEIKDQIALLFIKNIMKKISVEKLVQKEEFPFNDVNKLYNFMLKRYFVNREMREAGQKFKA